jgi:hypothetical protein
MEDLKGFTLGGPIIKDKLFFFASYEELKSSRSVPAFGPMGTDSVNVGITTQQIADAQALAKSKYNIDIGSLDKPAGVNLVAKDTLLKLDWNVSDNHKVNVRYTKSTEDNPIQPAVVVVQLVHAKQDAGNRGGPVVRRLDGQLLDRTQAVAARLQERPEEQQQSAPDRSHLDHTGAGGLGDWQPHVDVWHRAEPPFQ